MNRKNNTTPQKERSCMGQSSPFPSSAASRSGWFWVPSLYLAEGLPAALVTTVSLVMFSHLGVPTEKSLFWTGLYGLPWMLRPLWVPFIDRVGTPRSWAVVLQMLMGGLFAAAGFAAAMGAWFGALSFCFFAAAFASATHDAAADGFYIIALNASDQAKFSGIRSALYKAGTVIGQGGLAMAAGALAKFLSPGAAWGSVYAAAGLFMVLLGFWHLVLMPRPPETPKKGDPPKLSLLNFFAPYKETVTAPGFLKALAFLLLFRLAESQLRVAVPFLLAGRDAGGMGLSVGEQGFLYGTCGPLALIGGGILSGYLISRCGIKRWIFPMVLAINVPDLVYVYLSFFRPEALWVTGTCIFIEQLGYGFGFTLQTLCMVALARNKAGNETSCFALFTALSLLGVMLPGSFAGYLLKIPALLFPAADALFSYRLFFIWVILCTIPSFAVTFLMKKELCQAFPPPSEK